MTKKSFLEFIKGKLIVSVQGVEDEPTNDAHFLAVSARAVVSSGAQVLRCSQIEHISAIREMVGKEIPIIGLIKKKFNDSDVYITPTFSEIDQLAKLGIEAIAIDATFSKKPNNKDTKDLFDYARKNYPELALMADCATLEEVLYADKLGFDIVSTTLRGYTKDTKGESNIVNNFEFLRIIKSQNLKSIFIAEGGIWTPEDAKIALEISDAIVVGSAITRPHEIAKKYFNKIK